MQFKHCPLEIDRPVAVLRMDHQEVMNAVSMNMLGGLIEALAALSLIRKLYWDSPENSFEDQLNLEYRSRRIAGSSEGFREGVMAFLEKRPAEFAGT